MTEHLMTLGDVGRYLKVNTKTLRDLIDGGRLPYIDISIKASKQRRFRFRQSDVEAFQKKCVYFAQGEIYVVGFGPYVKIGLSRLSAKDRIAAIERGAPEHLHTYAIFPGNVQDELYLLNRFKKYSTRGEWFRNEGRLTQWLANGCKLRRKASGTPLPRAWKSPFHLGSHLSLGNPLWACPLLPLPRQCLPNPCA